TGDRHYTPIGIMVASGRKLPTVVISPLSCDWVQKAKRYLGIGKPVEGSWEVLTVTRSVEPLNRIAEGSIAVTDPVLRSVIVPVGLALSVPAVRVTRASGVMPGRAGKRGPRLA